MSKKDVKIFEKVYYYLKQSLNSLENWEVVSIDDSIDGNFGQAIKFTLEHTIENKEENSDEILQMNIELGYDEDFKWYLSALGNTIEEDNEIKDIEEFDEFDSLNKLEVFNWVEQFVEKVGLN